MTQYPHPPSGAGDPYRQHPGTDPYGRPVYGPPPQSSGEVVPVQAGGYEAPMAPVPAGGPTLTTIGDIAVTQTEVITPAGRFPIKGSVWTVTDMSRVEKTTPVWAIIVAILVFWWTCLLGLLFLLVKEERVTGHIQVTVQGGGTYHSTMVPALGRATGAHVAQQVNYARSLAA
ncbi:hypothetical protein [Nocardiopsis composta]|uniref:Uncharacterized protein n=1 Tax=Nocardiopsis composta TaxID=157465 RepID=A0A7W8QRE7_9ACTN|nr:hypothetical protein [Nocardiopsis composta]MBB5435230.1 hypothetical protein [Nocardiopsis composta]